MTNQELTNRIDDIGSEIGCLYDNLSQIKREIADLEQERVKLIQEDRCTHAYPNGDSAIDMEECDICWKLLD